MERTVEIGGIKVRLRASAGTLIIYKEQFGTDYITDMGAAKENPAALETGCRLLWSMARSADNSIPPPEQWFEGLGSFDIEKAFCFAGKLFEESCPELSEESSQGDPLTAENLAASALVCGLSLEELNRISLGMTLKIMNEYCEMKSGEEKAVPATQDDFDNF
ncbi:MAG: hypothetical protein J5994_10880 [Ruminococcus sp.]|nr:hypothetical protein [Ruminococcus sp.]